MNTFFEMLGPEGHGTYEVTWGKELELRRVAKPPDAYLIPGLVDIHIHGALGIDFMTASQEDMLSLAGALDGEGYESFLPTTVAAAPEDVLEAISNLPDDPRMPGFHLEGPFLNIKAAGAQPPFAIREPEPEMPEWDEVLNHPKLKVVTLAPELPHALSLITRLRNRGVVVSMGHTLATFEEARRGFEFGATNATHMFNAMRPFHHREAGIAGYALTSPGVTCELIYDRHHVCKEAAMLLLKCKPRDVIAVSDGSAATRLPAGTRLQMWGHDCEVDIGCVRIADSGALAGSSVTLKDCFVNLAADFGFEVAVDACCLAPRRALGITSTRRWVVLDRRFEVAEIRENGVRV